MIFRSLLLVSFALTALACEPVGPEGPRGDVLRYPAAVAVDPAGRYAYVLNTNFDSRYSGGSLVAVDLEQGHIVSSSAVETYSYGSRIVGHADAQGGFDRLYFTTREGNALNRATVTLNGAAA